MKRTPVIAGFARVLRGCAKSWRRVVGIVLMIAVTTGLILPLPTYAQFGLLGGIQNILNIINGTIRTALNGIRAV
jgi:hypothetical protein